MTNSPVPPAVLQIACNTLLLFARSQDCDLVVTVEPDQSEPTVIVTARKGRRVRELREYLAAVAQHAGIPTIALTVFEAGKEPIAETLVCEAEK